MQPIIQLNDRLQDFYDIFSYLTTSENQKVLFQFTEEISALASRVLATSALELSQIQIKIQALKEKSIKVRGEKPDTGLMLFGFFEKMGIKISDQTLICFGSKFIPSTFSEIRKHAPSFIKYLKEGIDLKEIIDLGSLLPEGIDDYYMDTIFFELISPKKEVGISFFEFLLYFEKKTFSQAILYIEMMDQLEALERFETFYSDFSEWALQFVDPEGDNIEEVFDALGVTALKVFVPNMPYGLFTNCLSRLLEKNKLKAMKFLDYFVRNKKGILFKLWKCASFFSNKGILYLISKRNDFNSLFYESDEILPAFFKIVLEFSQYIDIKLLKRFLLHTSIAKEQNYSLDHYPESLFCFCLGSLLDRGISSFSKSPSLTNAHKLKLAIELFLDNQAVQDAPIEKVAGKAFYLQKLIEAQILIDDLNGIKKTLLFKGARAVDKDLMISLIMTILHKLESLEDPKGFLEAFLNHPKALELSALEVLEILSFILAQQITSDVKLQLFQTLFDHPSAFLLKKEKLLELFDQIIEYGGCDLLVQKIFSHPNCFFSEKEPIHALIAKALSKDQLHIADHLKKLL